LQLVSGVTGSVRMELSLVGHGDVVADAIVDVSAQMQRVPLVLTARSPAPKSLRLMTDEAPRDDGIGSPRGMKFELFGGRLGVPR